MPCIRCICACLIALLALTGCSGGGDSTAPAWPRHLGQCVACHGVDGRPRIAGAPHLTARDKVELMAALDEYRTGQRDNALMQAAIRGLSDEILDELAQWYADQVLPEAGP